MKNIFLFALILLKFSCADISAVDSNNSLQELNLEDGHYVGETNHIVYRTDDDGPMSTTLTKTSSPFDDESCIDVDREVYLQANNLDAMEDATADVTHHVEILNGSVRHKTVVISYHEGKVIGVSCNQALSEGYIEVDGKKAGMYLELEYSGPYLGYEIYRKNNKLILSDEGTR